MSQMETVLSPLPVHMLFVYGWKHVVNAINMAAECLPATQRVEVPKLGGVVHGEPREVAAVKIDSPHGLRVVCQRRRAWRRRKSHSFTVSRHCLLPGECPGVEGNAGNPLLVALAGHYQLPFGTLQSFQVSSSLALIFACVGGTRRRTPHSCGPWKSLLIARALRREWKNKERWMLARFARGGAEASGLR